MITIEAQYNQGTILLIDENSFAFAPCLLHDRSGKLPWLHHWGDNFASTLREPAEPTIDSEDFDERLQAAVDQRQLGTSQRFQPFSPAGKPRWSKVFWGGSNKPHKGWVWQVPGGSKNHPGARSWRKWRWDWFPSGKPHEASAAMQGWFFCTENCTATQCFQGEGWQPEKASWVSWIEEIWSKFTSCFLESAYLRLCGFALIFLRFCTLRRGLFLSFLYQ